MRLSERRALLAVALPGLLVALAGCDIVTADLRHTETAEWRKTYQLDPGGRVEISNVNGTIEVESGTGNTVEVVAIKSARGGSQDDAKRALERVEIADESTPSSVKVQTRTQRSGAWFSSSPSVKYRVRVPAGARMEFETVNGGVELRGVSGEITAETTNGGITARDVAGTIVASTTNGGVDVDLARLDERGARLECTNGGVRLRLPPDARASITATVANGGIDTGGLQLEASESSRRRLEARLNGGGPSIRLEAVNGGIRIGPR